ncbi:aspartic proteinase CDR1-like [Nicotiana tabacum]|uniref:Aspartic proteinase CDR1-like n=1 Tax=Nicotiana tabacum TaxID=4097 RepID=A0A1S3ZQ28_TOBAC|nr:PREDICTED: aspartic proteinase CDR1-like [Nicotiana tabacum]
MANDNKNDANASLTRQQDAQGGKIRELVPKSTDTHCVHGEYVASFLIGSQLIKNYLLIDTGSGLLWWQCGPCEANNCYKQDQPLYNFTTSRISRKVDCIRRSSYCITADPTFHCDRDTSECIYNKKYTNGSGTKGFMADDVIYFVVDQRPIRFTFGCSNEQTGLFSSSYSGIVGLGHKVFPLVVPMVENPIGPFDTCYKVDPNGEELYFPVVKLYFGSVSRSTELILEQERAIVKYQGFYCLAFIGWQENYSILGVNQLHGVGLTFDTSANTLSFDINACD